ncbi:hypothetical protein ACFQZ4_26100 [Catellatospora coxensis]
MVAVMVVAVTVVSVVVPWTVISVPAARSLRAILSVVWTVVVSAVLMVSRRPSEVSR